MKVKNLLFILFALLIGLSSCKNESDLSNSIPAEAFYVVRVDAGSLIKKSEYDVFQNPLVQRGISLGKAFMKEDEAKILDSFLKDANSLGIDLKGECYTYITQDKFGLILKVLDAKKLNDDLKIAAKNANVEFKDGIYSITNPGSVVVWDNNKIIFTARLDYMSDQSKALLLEEAKTQLNLPEDKRITSIPQYKTFLSDVQDISTYYSLSKIQELIKNEKGSKQALEVLKELEGVSIVSYQSFDTGKITSSGKYLYDSDDTEKRFKTFVSQFSSSIKGDQLKFISKDPMLLVAANLNGKNTNNYLDKIQQMDNAGYNKSDLENIQKVLKYIDGDFTFAISDISEITTQTSDTISIVENDSVDGYLEENEDYSSNDLSNLAIKFTLLANVSYVDSLTNILEEEFSSKDKFEKLAPNVYVSKKDPNNILYIGLKDNLIFATTDASAYQSIIDNKAIENAYVGDVKNKIALVSGDVSKIKTTLFSGLGQSSYYYDKNTLDKVLALVSLFAQFDLSINADNFAMQGNLYMTNTKDNSLKSICAGIDQLISSLAPSIF